MSEVTNLPLKKEKKNKILWKGLFNYRCGIERLYAYAYSKEQARLIMCQRLAKKHEVHQSVVLMMFDGKKDNLIIEEEK